MIGWLRGKIIEKEQPGKLTLDVNGVGYEVDTSLSTFFQVEMVADSIQLFIHTVVREDALQLYGFLEKSERTLFRSLIKVNGIGPKMAIAILSSVKPAEFIQCIHDQNAGLLTKIPGIGNKTAQRLIIEMKDNLSINNLHSEVFSSDKLQQSEAIKALEALGYKNQEAVKAIKKIDDGSKTCEQLIRQALQILAS